YLDFKTVSARLAEESGWRLNEEYCPEASKQLCQERDGKTEALRRAMPRQPITKTYLPPKRFYKSDGQPSVLGQRWEERVVEGGFPEGYRGPIEEVVDYVDGNPGSHQQIKEWLYSLGWKPRTIKHVRNKESGEMKEIPQINKPPQDGGGVCESIVELYEKEPNLELLDGLFVLNHRIAILNGFIRDCRDG